MSTIATAFAQMDPRYRDHMDGRHGRWGLGVLLLLDGVAELIWFLQAFLLPAYPAIKTPGTFVSLLAEVGLALWLLVRGVKDKPVEASPSPTRTGTGATRR